MEKYKPYAIAFLGGTIYSTAWPTSLCDGLIFTAIPGLALLLLALLWEPQFWKKVRIALSFALPYTMIGFYWIPDTLAEFGELPYPIALLLGALFTFISAPHLYVVIIGVHFGLQRPKIQVLWGKFPGIFSFLIAASLTVIEYFTPQQFPVMAGGPFALIPDYLGFANVGGLPVYSFFSFLTAMEIATWFKMRSFSMLNLASVLVFVIANPFFKISNPEKNIENLNFRMVQANISNFLKVDSEGGGYASVSEVLGRYSDLSMEESELGDLDLVIWPETAYPFGVVTDKKNLAHTDLPGIFKDISLLHDSDVFIGGYDTIRDTGDYYKSEYNTNFHIGPDGNLKDTYHKHILIPFGETLPFGPLNRYLAKHIENISFFSEGTRFPLFETRTGHRFINTICYEILKPEFVRDYLNKHKERPHAMVNLTNDSWYGETSEPEQHLFLTKWRALEFDLPIIRSTNTGISVYVDANGNELKRLGVGETGNLDLSVQLGVREPTIFQIFGFWSLAPLWLALFIFHAILLKLKKE